MPTQPRRLPSLLSLPSQPRSEQAPASRVPEAPRVYSQEPGYVVATFGKCLVHINVDRPTATAVSLVRRALADLSEQHEKFAYLSILEPGVALQLSPDLRESINAYVRRYSSRFSASAVVFEQAGFQATVVRSLVTAIHLASHASHPSQVFEDLRGAVTWLSRMTPGESAPRLFEVAAQLRRDRPVSATPASTVLPTNRPEKNSR
jgi:hypothetical protein